MFLNKIINIKLNEATLKFATRAKKIKNNFKMNIKNSPEAL